MTDFRMDWCSHAAAEFACRRWHYSRSMPCSKIVKIGVWESGKYIGCVLFSRGATPHIGKSFKLKQTEVCELTRIALTDHVTPVSRIVSIAVRMLKKQSPGLRMIVSYADPEQGHHGGIYQAGNWVYIGHSGEVQHLVIDGKFLHRRSACSLYGCAIPEKIARMTGKPCSFGPFTWKHKYLMPLDDKMRHSISKLSKPYPKASEAGLVRVPLGTAEEHHLPGRSTA